MCMLTFIGDFFELHAETLQYFSYITFGLNITLLLIFICELHFLRKVKWFHLPHAFLMVIFSMISSIISSSFFLLSNTNNIYIKTICSFGPIIAISFRTASKTFTWALYVIRGQMVMESLDNILLSKLAKSAPFILVLQCILITTLITIFTETHYTQNESKCYVFYPLWLLICSALIGECIYGLGFLYIFYKAMSITMRNVYKSLNKSIAENTKKQIHHHITVYIIQLISSLMLLLFVSLCICFQTLIFFEFELFISNFCLLLLFRHKQELCKKAVYSSKYCCCSNTLETPDHLKPRPVCSRPVYSERVVSLNTNIDSPISPKLTSANSNYFFSNKWRSSREVINMKHALNAHNMPPSAKENKKVLELMGVKPSHNHTECNNNMDTATRVRTFSMDSIPTRDRHIGGSISSFHGGTNSIVDLTHFHVQSMSDPLSGAQLQSIPSNRSTMDDIDIDLPKDNPCITNGIQSKSTSAIVGIKLHSNGQKQLSQSQYLLSPETESNRNKKSKSFMMKFTEFIEKLQKKDDLSDNTPIETKETNTGLFSSFDTLDIMGDEKKIDNILSLSDPLTSVHEDNKKWLRAKKNNHSKSSSIPNIKLNKRMRENEGEVDFFDISHTNSCANTKL